MVLLRAWTGNLARSLHLSSLRNLKLISSPKASLSHIPTLKMQNLADGKRPICPNCSKPTRICLCSRIQNPGYDNSVNVTILQHSLEKKHPLNSTRIAKLGLKNVQVVTVSDVNLDAQFLIRCAEAVKSFLSPACENVSETINECNLGLRQVQESPRESNNMINVDLLRSNGIHTKGENLSMIEECIDRDVVWFPMITADISKYGSNCSIRCHSMPHAEGNIPDFEHLLAAKELAGALSAGFVVKKLQRKIILGSMEVEEEEEFELEVPAGSVLLFPSEKAMDVKGLKTVGFDLKNLIVLDGTWAKATRMYNENPWLKLLPHLKLDVDKMSLYSEVRQQPRAECLSTIESIVFALKEFGEETSGLDNLLHVFESMVGDQRRCKQERLSKDSQSCS